MILAIPYLFLISERHREGKDILLSDLEPGQQTMHESKREVFFLCVCASVHECGCVCMFVDA